MSLRSSYQEAIIANLPKIPDHLRTSAQIRKDEKLSETRCRVMLNKLVEDGLWTKKKFQTVRNGFAVPMWFYGPKKS
jgi:hypothetical protein